MKNNSDLAFSMLIVFIVDRTYNDIVQKNICNGFIYHSKIKLIIEIFYNRVIKFLQIKILRVKLDDFTSIFTFTFHSSFEI